MRMNLTATEIVNAGVALWRVRDTDITKSNDEIAALIDDINTNLLPLNKLVLDPVRAMEDVDGKIVLKGAADKTISGIEIRHMGTSILRGALYQFLELGGGETTKAWRPFAKIGWETSIGAMATRSEDGVVYWEKLALSKGVDLNPRSIPTMNLAIDTIGKTNSFLNMTTFWNRGWGSSVMQTGNLLKYPAKKEVARSDKLKSFIEEHRSQISGCFKVDPKKGPCKVNRWSNGNSSKHFCEPDPMHEPLDPVDVTREMNTYCKMACNNKRLKMADGDSILYVCHGSTTIGAIGDLSGSRHKHRTVDMTPLTKTKREKMNKLKRSIGPVVVGGLAMALMGGMSTMLCIARGRNF
jgi:hypothetical protein